MRRVAVVGVGMTKFGSSDKSQVEMFSDAAMEAINESNIRAKDIQALFLGNGLGDFEEGQMNMAPMCAAELGMPMDAPATRVEGACASASVAIRDAFMWVASGFYDIVLAGGTERATAMGTPLATRTFAMGSDSKYEGFNGITFPGAFAMVARLYANKYGISLEKLKERMAMVAVKNHKNGVKNPLAQFQKEITVETVLNSFIVADPLQLFDCCPFSDGAAAIVLASEEVAKRLTDKPVYILGVGQASNGPLYRQKDITRIRAREAAAAQAYKMAGLTPADIDVCELHDCFTIAEIVASEGLGFFAFGKGSEAVEKGETAIGGRIPINPSGGLKAKGHPIGATGAAQAYEIVKQLRGECGDRQVKGARVGMTDTLGGDFATVVNIIYGI
ncbi:thiolase domain-containing protein [Desulfoscipio geothermicus]|uniref:Acetyl-CoA C-acetyltransferase n=1 Tax=Desulfoscipio geothermicus DSM 3669 TaxID=1121426 RepID=A0A1I6CQI4_9FIRM|nr:thiolase domain-containing protein [Desulfoscipio geothermicus]SFQ95417.1 acetyl-CoA C-acetyltransferase [Desulfoscipio geothermicus DSM 3669]